MPVSLLCSIFFYDKFDTFKKTLMTDDFPSSLYSSPEESQKTTDVSGEPAPFAQPTNDPFASPENYPTAPSDDDTGDGRAYVVAIVVFILLVLAAVGFSYRKKNPQNPIVDNDEPTIGISAKNGGKIVTFDGAVVTIPAGALKEDTQIFITKIADGPVTDLYKIEPEGLKFLKPITLEIPYKESGLKYNETPNDIDLKYWLLDGDPRTLLSYEVNEEKKLLKAQVSEL